MNAAQNGYPYAIEEREILNRLARVIDTPEEMEKVAPYFAVAMGRSVSAIQKQIELRKIAEGRKDFFWKRK
jgi:hypothetical protein